MALAEPGGMKVRLLPADEGGCAFYRHEEPARVAAAEGIETLVHHGDFARAQTIDGSIVVGERHEKDGQPGVIPWDDDVVVFQRPAKNTTSEFTIPALQARGIACVVDVDDDFSALHPQHAAQRHFNPRLNPEVNHRNLARACGMADLVTCTTPALAERYGAHGRVAVLPNCVPASYLGMPRANDGHTVGWGGALAYHPGDLQATCGGVMEALRRKPDWRFLLVGPPEGVRTALSLEQTPDSTGGVTLEEWPVALAQLDVGIVPLADNAFNRAKSWLKGIEYAALGIPFVASPLPEYQRLAAEGIGRIAEPRSRNWRRELVQLMDDESLRHELAEQARQAVLESHVYENEGWRWPEAWSEAIGHRRGARLAA